MDRFVCRIQSSEPIFIDGKFLTGNFYYKKKCQEIEKNTPLHHAAFHGDLKAVQLLVEEGADVNACWFSRTPLLIACGSFENNIFEPRSSLLGEDRFDHTPPRTPYYHQAIAEYLIEIGADINVCDGADRTALDLSCEAGNFEVVKQLNDRSATINITGYSTLHRAVKGGNPQIVQLIANEIVSSNKNINHMICFGEGSPLELAVKRMWNHPNVCQIVEILLRAGMHVNGPPHFINETPLHSICKNVASPIGLLKLLLKYNADINATSYMAGPPLNYVLRRFLDPADLDSTLREHEKVVIILDHISNIGINKLYVNPNDMISLCRMMESELKLMKNPINELNGLSVFDIVTKNIDIAGSILENQSINGILSSLVEKLPLSGTSLNNKCLQIRSRRLLFLSACDVFTKHIFSYKLPLELVKKCCMLLSTSDLHNLSEVIKM